MNIEQKAREAVADLPLMKIGESVEAPRELWVRVIASALQSAVEEEREECAKLAETGDIQHLGEGASRIKIAAAIRSRGTDK